MCGTVEEKDGKVIGLLLEYCCCRLGTKKASKQKDESADGQAHTEFIQINLGVWIQGGLNRLVFYATELRAKSFASPCGREWEKLKKR